MSCQKLSHRYLNLVVRGGHGFYSMRRKDVSELFYASTAQAETVSDEVKVKKTSIERLPCPRGNYEVEPSRSDSWINVFAPLGKNNVVCVDSAGNATLYNTVSNTFLSMPTLNSPKGPRYIALSIPNTAAQVHSGINVDINPKENLNVFTDKFHREHDNLYIMDMVPGKPCCFEVLTCYPHGAMGIGVGMHSHHHHSSAILIMSPLTKYLLLWSMTPGSACQLQTKPSPLTQ
ncbi:unnamed protein product [Urochloa humidicola]